MCKRMLCLPTLDYCALAFSKFSRMLMSLLANVDINYLISFPNSTKINLLERKEKV